MADRVVAIHQPNFFPWLGYFDKLARADVFVLLDSVQFPRSGHGEWMNRVKLLVQGRPSWVTAPVLRRGTQRIHEVRMDEDQPWRRKLLRTLETSYARAPFFSETFTLVEELLADETDVLADFNEAAVRRLASVLGIETELVRSSTLDAEGAGSELLAELTLAVRGTTYLSGDGADEYQDPASYARRGIEVRFQQFRQPEYLQLVEPFVQGLSVVDALMSVGAEGVRRLQFAR